MDDAIRFFRGEFTKAHVDPEKFDKEYTYGIRYNYGKEGKKVNWAPWNCMRVITQSVGAGECNGCPYRHHDPDILRGHLAQSGKKIIFFWYLKREEAAWLGLAISEDAK
jgi:DNA primase large subunit